MVKSMEISAVKGISSCTAGVVAGCGMTQRGAGPEAKGAIERDLQVDAVEGK